MKVILSHTAHLKLKYYVEEIGYEISGIGEVVKLENGDLYVPDVYLFEQEVTGTETVLDHQSLDKFYDDLLNQEFANDEEREAMWDKIGRMKLWWHSHVNMAVFWSGVDIATQNSLDTDQDAENWWLSIVCNKKGERKAKLDVYRPHRMFMDDLDIVVGEDNNLREQIKEEIKEKVTIRKPKGNVIPANNWQNRWNGKGGYQQPTVIKPHTTDMQDMVDQLEDEEDWEETGMGIYVPKKNKKLRNANNRRIA